MSQAKITTYELNQQGYSAKNFIPMTEEQRQKKFEEIEMWINSLPNMKYVGLLCRDMHDYTVFNIFNNNAKKTVEELEKLLNNRGKILDIQYESNNFGECYQCWIEVPVVNNEDLEILKDLNLKDVDLTPKVYMYMLFNAYDWIIEIKED